MGFLDEIRKQGEDYRERVGVQARKLGLIRDDAEDDETEDDEPENSTDED